ncbi:MAG TPA: lipid-binding SYLF domain-containing protein [Vicinamibacterales bacterium]|jgi:lipid-binding SYLF domain-containing protein|nr:lipid-binding SYLF domain-containing protein [Vicinamibacterales bacterium]
MKSYRTLLILSALLIGMPASAAYAQSADTKDEVEQSQKAAKVFQEIMSAPDKAIPQSVLDGADCVAVFPNVVQAAFGVGGRGGRGLASCRTASGWSAPAYFNLGGGSFGFQIGVESTDLIMLFMTPESMKTLTSSKFELGADAAVAAGPVGRQAAAGTDLKMDAQILSYSRNKGLFAGVALKGAVIQTADDDMRDVYGAGVHPRDVLTGGKMPSTQSVMAFPTALGEHIHRTN